MSSGKPVSLSLSVLTLFVSFMPLPSSAAAKRGGGERERGEKGFSANFYALESDALERRRLKGEEGKRRRG